MVEMGHDRIHHGFWKFMDAEHRKHEPGNAFESAILDYYRHVDGLIAGLLEHADEETLVLVVSDHGAKRLDGGIRVNEWLRREGLLGAPGRAERRLPAARGRDRLAADDGLGRRRLLRAHLPQRRGPRAGRCRSPPEDYEPLRDDLTGGSPRSPDDRGEADGDCRLQARGAVRRR